MDLTQLLQRANAGNDDARAEIVQLAYDDLRRLATAYMKRERQDHSLGATALVNEVAMRLLGDGEVPEQNRDQFLAFVAKAMRNLLIDHARTKGRQKRGGDRERVAFEDAVAASVSQSEDLLELNDALTRLSEVDPRKAKVVEMRYFGGMTIPEVAAALQISPATVKRDWEVARTWLYNEMQSGTDTSAGEQ